MERANVKGMLSKNQFVENVKNKNVDTVILAFTDHYGRLMGKRLDADFFIESGGTHACDYLLTVDMEMEPVQGYRFSNWESGYGDFKLQPDWNTARVLSWLEKTALIICDVVDEKQGELVSVAPRSILKKQIDYCRDMSFEPQAGTELEYYIFDESYQTLAGRKYNDPQPAGWYIEDYHILQGTREEKFNGVARRHLRDSGVPVEMSKGEWGKGQHELNVRYADMLTMADRHCVFKQCLKEVADSQEISVTFMAKYQEDHAGSSCHIHVSLWRDGKNAFAGEQPLGPVKGSDIFRWFLGGWIHHVPDVMVFYAPTINSYKRYQAGSWAPTRMAWSYDNRTAGFRVVGKGDSLRIECRIPGADCNPYLALAASLASGLEGIRNKIEPPAIFSGDVYKAESLEHVPGTLTEATELFKNSEFARSALGDEVVDHYSHFFETEIKAFQNSVTDWERKRYFERI